jgi:hypothetical protein
LRGAYPSKVPSHERASEQYDSLYPTFWQRMQSRPDWAAAGGELSFASVRRVCAIRSAMVDGANKLMTRVTTAATSVNVRGTSRLTSAAISEVLNRVCDMVIWLMSANKILANRPEYSFRGGANVLVGDL